MVVNLSDLFVADGNLPFAFPLDLSDLDFYGVYPLQTPVKVSGNIQSRAGIVTLQLKAEYLYSSPCDRCATPAEREYSLSMERTLVRELFDLDDERFIQVEGDELDLGEIARTEVILSVPGKFLCKPDCKGICDRCGANLNETSCDCYKEKIDPRLAALKDFFNE